MKGVRSTKSDHGRALDALRKGLATPSVRLLLVEDGPGDARTAGLLAQYDDVIFDVECVRTSDECLQALAGDRFDLLLLDDSIPSESVRELLRRVSGDGDAIPVILLAGDAGEAATEQAVACGAHDVIRKDSTAYLTLGATVHQSLLGYHREDEERRARAELERLTVVDGLTGLHNKRHLIDILDCECHRTRRYATAMSLLMIDLDDFSLCNRSHGQQAGDELLRRVAAALKTSVRKSDAVARYGRDVFCLLAPETDHNGAMQLAERLRFEIAARRLAAGEGSEPVTISIGVYTPGPGQDFTPDEIIATAEAALREAKTSGKNKVCGRSTETPEAEPQLPFDTP